MAATLRDFRERFVARRHSVLLAAIVFAFAVRPLIGDAVAGPFVFSISLLALMLVALYAIQVDELVGERTVLLAQRRNRNIVGWTLALLAIALRLGTLWAPSPQLYMLGSISWLLFFSFVTWAELRSVLRQREVTRETISMSISVYLLLGLCWGLVYVAIFQHQPLAFSFGASSAPPLDAPNVYAIFMYFSLTTLSTIGFGDITPVSLQARYMAVAQGITGQFYLAILVARLVGIQMSRSAQHDTAGD